MKSVRNFFKGSRNDKFKFILLCAFLIGCVIASIYSYKSASEDERSRRFYESMIEDADKISYIQFISMMQDGQIDTIYYKDNEEYMVVTKSLMEERELTTEDCLSVLYPGGESFREGMLLHDVNLVRVKNDPRINMAITILTTMLPLLMIAVFYTVLYNKVYGGNSISEVDIIQKNDVTLSDIIGLDEIMEELNIVIKMISDPLAGIQLGAKIPHGILLSGPAGVGKTMIAKAISNAVGVPFISMNGSDFQELYVGNGARHVRQLFAIARKKSPCIVFIDEFDAIGVRRDSVSSNSEDSKTINALLKEMDGFQPLDGVFVIAATNYPGKLDSAITRSGRFDREIEVPPPKDWSVREQLFTKYLKDKPLYGDVDIEHLAKTVGGFTGADVATVCNEASLVAMARGLSYITLSCLEEAIDRKVFKGSYSKNKAHEPDRKIVARHEAGHAVMAILLGQKVSRASIRSTTSGVGGAVFHEDTDSQFVTQKELEDRVMVAYAGRIAEELGFESVTTGAVNDIEDATKILFSYVAKYGMSYEVGPLNTDVLLDCGIESREVSFKSIKHEADRLYEGAKTLLDNNYDSVKKLADKLLEVEVMSGEEITDFLGLEVLDHE